MSGCAGCNSEDVDFEKFQKQMEETKSSLQTIVNKLNNIDFNIDHFDSLDKKINDLKKAIESEEFVDRLAGSANFPADLRKQMEDIKKEGRNSLSDYTDRLKEQPKRNPIGYVYIDENGEQKFSPTKPEGVTSTAVYGD